MDKKKRERKKNKKKKIIWSRAGFEPLRGVRTVISRYASSLRYGGQRFVKGITMYLTLTRVESINGKEWSSQNFPSGL